MAGQQLVSIFNFRADDMGCGFYRMIFPALACRTAIGCPYMFRFTQTLDPIFDVNYYKLANGVKMVRVQRWFGPDKAKLVKEFLKPLSIQLGFWLVYEIDDVLIGDEIPNYNMAKPFYEQKETQDSIKEIMSLCDLITVTTQELADLYAERYNIPKDKFIVIPNYLPRWWAGDAYDFNHQMALWKATRNKPRVAIACSLNHFDIHNKNNGIDDFSHIIPWIDHHIQRGDIQFIFVRKCSKTTRKIYTNKTNRISTTV